MAEDLVKQGRHNLKEIIETIYKATGIKLKVNFTTRGGDRP